MTMAIAVTNWHAMHIAQNCHSYIRDSPFGKMIKDEASLCNMKNEYESKNIALFMSEKAFIYANHCWGLL